MRGGSDHKYGLTESCSSASATRSNVQWPMFKDSITAKFQGLLGLQYLAGPYCTQLRSALLIALCGGLRENQALRQTPRLTALPPQPGNADYSSIRVFRSQHKVQTYVKIRLAALFDGGLKGTTQLADSSDSAFAQPFRPDRCGRAKTVCFDLFLHRPF